MNGGPIWIEKDGQPGEKKTSGGEQSDQKASPELQDSMLGVLALIALEGLLRWLAPLSYAFLAATPIFWRYWRPPIWLLAFAFSECAFYIDFLFRRRALLALEAPLPAPSATERDRVVRRVVAELEEDGVELARERLLGWFIKRSAVPKPHRWFRRWRAERQWTFREGRNDACSVEEIRRENIESMLASAFFQQTVEHVNARPAQARAMESYIESFERVIRHRFAPGNNPDVYVIRHGMEPVRLEHRPLLFYAAVLAATKVVEVIMRLVGFERHSIEVPTWQKRGQYRVKPFRFFYWYHPGVPAQQNLFCRLVRRLSPREEDNEAKTPYVPIVFIAGLGGLVSLIHIFIPLLILSRRPIYAVGNPHVSLRLASAAAKRASHALDAGGPARDETDDEDEDALWDAQAMAEDEQAPVASIPTLADQARGIRIALHRHGHVASKSRRRDMGTGPGAIIVSHSLGTSLATFLARVDPCLVAYNFMIDLITLSLWDGYLVRAFIYSEAKTIGQRFIRLFSREIGIAYTLYVAASRLSDVRSNRAFTWFACAGFPHRDGEPEEGAFDPQRTFVLLSEADALVRADMSTRLLDRAGVPYYVLPGALHAGFLMVPQWTALAIRMIIDCANKAPRPRPRRRPSRTPIALLKSASPTVAATPLSPIGPPISANPGARARARSRAASISMAMTPRSPLGPLATSPRISPTLALRSPITTGVAHFRAPSSSYFGAALGLQPVASTSTSYPIDELSPTTTQAFANSGTIRLRQPRPRSSSAAIMPSAKTA